MTTIRLDHLASRWDRSPESLASDVRRSIRQGAHVISRHRGRGRQALAGRWSTHGCTTCQDRTPWQAGESAILVDDDFGEVARLGRPRRSAPTSAPATPSTRSSLSSGSAATGEDPARRREPPPVVGREQVEAASRDRVPQVRPQLPRGRPRDARKWKPDAVCVWADWNLNLNLAWVRDWAKRVWAKRGKSLGKHKTPAKGSHGNRLIDWPITHGLQRAS